MTGSLLLFFTFLIIFKTIEYDLGFRLGFITYGILSLGFIWLQRRANRVYEAECQRTKHANSLRSFYDFDTVTEWVEQMNLDCTIYDFGIPGQPHLSGHIEFHDPNDEVLFVLKYGQIE